METNLSRRIALRIWDRETASMDTGAGEINLLVDFERSMAVSGLARVLKQRLELDGYLVQQDIDDEVNLFLEGDVLDSPAHLTLVPDVSDDPRPYVA